MREACKRGNFIACELAWEQHGGSVNVGELLGLSLQSKKQGMIKYIVDKFCNSKDALWSHAQLEDFYSNLYIDQSVETIELLQPYISGVVSSEQGFILACQHGNMSVVKHYAGNTSINAVEKGVVRACNYYPEISGYLIDRCNINVSYLLLQCEEKDIVLLLKISKKPIDSNDLIQRLHNSVVTSNNADDQIEKLITVINYLTNSHHNMISPVLLIIMYKYYRALEYRPIVDAIVDHMQLK